MTTPTESTYQQFYNRLLQAPAYLGLPQAKRPACKRFVLLAAQLGTDSPQLRGAKAATKSKGKSSKPASQAQGEPAPEQPAPQKARVDFPLLAEAHAAIDALVETGRRKGRLNGVARVLDQIIAACARLEAKLEGGAASPVARDEVAATS